MTTIESLFGVVLFGLVCLLTSTVEYRRDRALITPFNALAWPFFIIVALINLVAVRLGFFAVSLTSLLFIIAGLIFFKAGDLTVKKLRPLRLGQPPPQDLNFFAFYRPVFVALALISLLAGFIHFQNALKLVGGWIGIASPDFEDAFGKGLLAHIMVLNRPAMLFLVADYFQHRKPYILVLIALMFISILILQIKFHIITILIASILFSHFYKPIHFNLKKTLFYSLTIYGLFNLSYTIGFSRIGVGQAYSSNIQLYLLNHFFTYLFGGPIGFSEILSNPIYPLYAYEPVFSVPINIYRTLTGNPQVVDTIIHHWVPVSNIYQYFHSSNVFTLMGMLYMFIGPYWTLIYMYCLGTLFSVLQFKAKVSMGWRMVYAFFMAHLIISFFGLYFNFLLLWEAAIFMLVMPWGFRVLHRGLQAINRSLT